MQTERIHGSTMEEALRKVHEEVGPDALILSAAGAAPEGVVIVAGVQPREGASRGAAPTERFDPFESRVALERHLRSQGILAKLSAIVARELAPGGDGASGARRALSKLVRCRRPVLEEDSVIAVVGPSGAGKTTTLAKLAARTLALEDRGVAIVTLDTYRVGAVEQLRAYAQMMEAPFHVAFTPADLRKTIAQQGTRYRVLVDTAGRSPYDHQQLGLLRGFLGGDLKLVAYLVLSVATAAHELVEAVRRFSVLHPDSLVLTKIDECSHLGTLVNLPFVTGLPVGYLGNGPEVPRHLLVARPARIATALLARDPSRVLSEVADE
ncbi:MAG: hypothetical protein AB1486_10010 [Planctomycetota bacterium]